MVCQQMTGTNAINYYAPLIFGNLGVQGLSTGLFSIDIYGVVRMTTFACFLLFAADSLGRRKSLLWRSTAQGCAMFLIGIYVRVDLPVAGAVIPSFGYVTLVCIFFFAAFFSSDGPLLLDLHQRDPNCPSPQHERRNCSCHSVAF
jgi:hypothetical protein